MVSSLGFVVGYSCRLFSKSSGSLKSSSFIRGSQPLPSFLNPATTHNEKVEGPPYSRGSVSSLSLWNQSPTQRPSSIMSMTKTPHIPQQNTWNYTPYQPTTLPSNNPTIASQSHPYSTPTDKDHWPIPSKLTIPEQKLQFTFTRSSGPGGQNVNKVNTQVTLKFYLLEASWIPLEVRERIQSNEANRINKEGYLVLNSQEYRTQIKNRKHVLDKLQDIIQDNYPRPKVRKMRTGVSGVMKEMNKVNKRRRSQVKQSRGRVHVDF